MQLQLQAVMNTAEYMNGKAYCRTPLANARTMAHGLRPPRGSGSIAHENSSSSCYIRGVCLCNGTDQKASRFPVKSREAGVILNKL